MCLSSIGMFFTLQTSLILSVFFVILIFVGFALGQYSFNTMVPLVLRDNRVGMGTGFYQLNNFVGVSVGPAIFTRLMIVNGGTKWEVCFMCMFKFRSCNLFLASYEKLKVLQTLKLSFS